jgi:uncharacterized protein YdaU (DUF1376 family)
MAALPYMQFHIAEYLADTSHLSTEEHGAYLLLIFNYWQRGKSLDNANGRLSNVVKLSNERWTVVADALKEFFVIEGEVWTHLRIERDLAAVNAKCEQARNARSQRKNYGRTTDVTTSVVTDDQREANDKKRIEEEEKKKREEELKALASTANAVPASRGKLLGTLPLNDGSDWEIYSLDADELQKLYPAVDVLQEFRSMKGWLIGNPTNLKTRRGIKRFISAWLDKEQDKAKPNGLGGKINGKIDRAYNAAAKLIQEVEDYHGPHTGELLPWRGAE